MSQVILAPSEDFKKSARIKVKHFRVVEETLKEEIEKGIHDETYRPISGLLNHSDLVSGEGKALELYEKFMDTVGVPIDIDTTVDDARAEADGKEIKDKKITDKLKKLRAEAKKVGVPAYWNMKPAVLKKQIRELPKLRKKAKDMGIKEVDTMTMIQVNEAMKEAQKATV